MKKLLSLLIVINAIIVFLGVGLFYVSETHPFRPGDTFYNVQSTAETWRVRLSPRGEKQTALAISLAEQRLVHLARVENHEELDAAIIAFEAALDQAIGYVEVTESSPEYQPSASPQLNMLLSKAQLVVYALDKKLDDCELLDNLKTKIESRIEVSPPVEPSDEVNIAVSDQAPMVIEAEVISFLGNEIDHSAYPLNGKHETTDCLLCHYSGEYANTPTDCASCHTDFTVSDESETPALIGLANSKNPEPSSIYPNHFEGTCDECHSEESWKPISFDHENILECRSCHIEDTPVSETGAQDLHAVYPNQCMICHEDVESWETITYSHEDVIECLSCHEAEEPAEHYTNSTCEDCHTAVEDWNEFEFDHTGYSDCANCHQPSTEHYLGTCSVCHNNTRDWYIYDFYHIGGMTDCKTCHVLEENHYSGQCSNCHTKEAWLPADFRHVGYTPYQCSTCHRDDAPSNHFSNTCGHCHNTVAWSQVHFNHTGLSDCESCHSAPSGHYDGQCSNCHNTNSWSDYNFSHSGLNNCQSCHSGPAGHYDLQCSNCHNTNSWNDYNFNHTGLSDCQSCHTAPDGHYVGQCSNCHKTTNWRDVNYSHTDDKNCTGCHQAPDHYSGQCSNCHISTSNWEKIQMDHSSGYSDCKACHGDERPPSPHPSNGQCSRCHTTDSWKPPTATPTEIPTNTPVPSATFTPSPTLTPTDTYTPIPTSTGTVTEAPPTNTPLPPTNTPVPPTNTPVPPTNTPTPTPTPYHHDGDDCSECHN